MSGFSPQAERAIRVLREELNENEYVVLTPEEARKMLEIDTDDIPEDLTNALDCAQGDAAQGKKNVFILIEVTIS